MRNRAIIAIRETVFGMTQASFADALGVNQSTVSRWENGAFEPTRADLIAIRKLAAARSIRWSDTWFFEAPANATDDTQEGRHNWWSLLLRHLFGTRLPRSSPLTRGAR